MVGTHKHYISKDGNGGINVSNGIALITLIFIMLISSIPAVFSYARLSERVNTYVDISEEIKNTCITELKNIDDEVHENKEDIIALNVKLDVLIKNQDQIIILLNEKE